MADPDLCLDSHVDAGVVILGKCADEKAKRADDVRYDLTVQGELLPRWDEQLALASTAADAGADIVVKVRDGSDGPALADRPGDIGQPRLAVERGGGDAGGAGGAGRSAWRGVGVVPRWGRWSSAAPLWLVAQFPAPPFMVLPKRLVHDVARCPARQEVRRRSGRRPGRCGPASRG